MAWTTPKTDWSTGELVTAADINAIGANLVALRHPSTAVATYTTTEDIEVNIRDFADIDSGNLNLTITTAGGDVLVHFHGSINLLRNHSVFLDIEIDGARIGGADGILKHKLVSVSSSQRASNLLSFTRLIQNLSAGSHTFKLQWKGTYIQVLEAGAQFWAREI